MNIFDIIISLLSGGLAGLGFGGGWILYAYLTGFGGATQSEARGLVLMLFIPCAVIALVGHIKNKLVEVKTIWPAAVAGAAAVAAGFWVFDMLNHDKLRWLMAIIVAIFGIYELAAGIKEARR